MRCTISTLHCLMNSFSVLFNVQHQAENLGASLSFLSTVDKEAVAEPAAHTKINSSQHTHSRGSPGTGKKGDRVKSGPGGEERGEEEGHRSKYGQLFFFSFSSFPFNPAHCKESSLSLVPQANASGFTQATTEITQLLFPHK